MSRAWITELPDGRTQYIFHQSWLADTDLCLERARLGLLDDLWDPPSDATSLGTSMHHAIELGIDSVIDMGEPLGLDQLLDQAQTKFTEEIASEGFTWKKRAERGARNYLEKAVTNWYDAILWKLDPWFTELSFGPYVLYEDDQRVVQLGGTIDYVDRKHGLMDWKTGSPHTWAGKEWEKSRWAVQPTVYCWSWERFCEEHDLPAPPDPQPFRFVVMRDDGAVQKVLVERRKEDYVWLEQKVRAIVGLIEGMGTEGPWPKTDTHALCSGKWCPAWAQCKGAVVHPNWPK